MPSMATTPAEPPPERQSGFLLLRLNMRQGFTIGDAEVFLNAFDRDKGEITVAIRAPKEIRIRKIR